jgi:hypothetical protein
MALCEELITALLDAHRFAAERSNATELPGALVKGPNDEKTNAVAITAGFNDRPSRRNPSPSNSQVRLRYAAGRVLQALPLIEKLCFRNWLRLLGQTWGRAADLLTASLADSKSAATPSR